MNLFSPSFSCAVLIASRVIGPSVIKVFLFPNEKSKDYVHIKTRDIKDSLYWLGVPVEYKVHCMPLTEVLLALVNKMLCCRKQKSQFSNTVCLPCDEMSLYPFALLDLGQEYTRMQEDSNWTHRFSPLPPV